MGAARRASRRRSSPKRISDSFWALVKPLIPPKLRKSGKFYRREPGAGRKPIPARRVFAAITYVLRTGSPWKSLPRSFGSASAIHRYFDTWHAAGFFLKLWQAGLAEHEEMEGIAWQWQRSHDDDVRNKRKTESTSNPSDSRDTTNHDRRIQRRAWQPSLARRQRREVRRNNFAE
jgi:transposase